MPFLKDPVRGVLRFSNPCSECSMFTRSFMKIPLEAHYRVRKVCQIRRHFSSEPVGTPTNDSCGTDCCDYNPPLARSPTAMSHFKLFEQACKHGNGWHAARRSMKKRTDGAVACSCCRFGNEQ